jgi:hypothetical protein
VQTRYTAEYYLERADETRAVARTMRNANARQMMLDNTTGFERLAQQVNGTAAQEVQIGG